MTEANETKKHVGWVRFLRRSIINNRSLQHSMYCQMATVEPDTGFPTNRTIKVEQVLDDGTIVLCTDTRSPKIKHLLKQPWSEVCWFFPLTKEQWRLAGPTVVVTDTSGSEQERHLRTQVWQSLDNALRQLAEIPAPSTFKRTDVVLGDLDKYEPQPVDSQVPSPNFCVLLLRSQRVDQLSIPIALRDPTKVLRKESLLKPAKQMARYLHTKSSEDEEWQTRELNP